MYKEQLSAIGEEVDSKISNLQTDLASARDAYSAASASLAAANVTIDQLRARIAELEAAQPQPIKAAVGMSQENFDAVVARAGELEAIRSFSAPGKMPTAWSATSAASSIGKRKVVYSFKGAVADITKACDDMIAGKYDASLTTLLTSVPGDIAVIFRHEPDNDGGDRDKFRKAQVAMRKLIDKINVAGKAKHGDKWQKILFGACLQTWSFETTKWDIEELWPGEGVWDFISWDGYTAKDKNHVVETPAKMWDKAVAWNKSHGNSAFAISEFGSDVGGGDRNQFIKDTVAYAKSKNALWVCYWNAKTDDGNYILTASEEKTLASFS